MEKHYDSWIAMEKHYESSKSRAVGSTTTSVEGLAKTTLRVTAASTLIQIPRTPADARGHRRKHRDPHRAMESTATLQLLSSKQLSIEATAVDSLSWLEAAPCYWEEDRVTPCVGGCSGDWAAR
jgi:hypothetical protein